MEIELELTDDRFCNGCKCAVRYDSYSEMDISEYCFAGMDWEDVYHYCGIVNKIDGYFWDSFFHGQGTFNFGFSLAVALAISVVLSFIDTK